MGLRLGSRSTHRRCHTALPGGALVGEVWAFVQEEMTVKSSAVKEAQPRDLALDPLAVPDETTVF